MKKLLLIITLLFFQFGFSVSAETNADYNNVPYVGTEINKALNGNLPFVLVIADPNDRASIIQYFPIGKMVYSEFQGKYDFCIMNSNVEANKEYIEFFKPENLPEVYVVIPKKNIYGRISKECHNATEMRRILNNLIEIKR